MKQHADISYRTIAEIQKEYKITNFSEWVWRYAGTIMRNGTDRISLEGISGKIYSLIQSRFHGYNMGKIKNLYDETKRN